MPIQRAKKLMKRSQCLVRQRRKGLTQSRGVLRTLVVLRILRILAMFSLLPRWLRHKMVWCTFCKPPHQLSSKNASRHLRRMKNPKPPGPEPYLKNPVKPGFQGGWAW